MRESQLVNILKKIYLFNSLDENRLQELAVISAVYRYKKDSILFMEGELSDSLMILVEGEVKICKHDDKGNKVNIGFFTPYALLAESATLRGTPFPSSAYFETDAAVVKIQLDAFTQNFMRDPHISYEIIQSLLEKVQLLQNNIHMNLASTAKEKILTFYERNENLKLEMKNYEIASLLGISAETFSRNAKQLEKEGKIQKLEHSYCLI